MNFNLNQEQQMLQDTVARLVRDQYPFDQREMFAGSAEGFSVGFWRQLGELGITALPVAEAYDGIGAGATETLVVMTELGRGLCLEPYLQSVIFGAGLLAQLGSNAQKAELLPAVASATVQLAVALDEPQSHYCLADVQTRAHLQTDGWQLSGRKSVVVGGQTADLLLVSARSGGQSRDEEGISLYLVDPAAAGVRRREYPTIDGRRACDLFLDKAPAVLLGEAGKALPALRYQQGRAIAAQCAEAVGSMQAACALTLDYLKTRQQFGQPIGKFQALQHRMVDMQIELDQAMSMAILAACVADEPDSDSRSRGLAAAKFIVSRAARLVADQSIQLHGGIGLTWEYVVSHHAKHLLMVARQFGDDDHHLQAFSHLMVTP